MRVVLGAFLLALVSASHAEVLHAKGRETPEKFFEKFVARTNAFDAEIADLYSDVARIITLRDGTKRLELTGAQWKTLLAQAMPLARKRGDKDTFENVQATPQADRVRITATRTSAVKCAPDPNYHLDIEPAGDSWRIVEEYTETVSLSRCPPSKDLENSLAAIRAGIAPRLPLDLDADTRLEAIEVVGPALIYRQRLHTVAAAELDLKATVAALRQLGIQYACVPEMKALVTAGATIRYETLDRDGAELATVDVAPGDVSLVAPLRLPCCAIQRIQHRSCACEEPVRFDPGRPGTEGHASRPRRLLTKC